MLLQAMLWPLVALLKGVRWLVQVGLLLVGVLAVLILVGAGWLGNDDSG
jgi:hypothetical protein